MAYKRKRTISKRRRTTTKRRTTKRAAGSKLTRAIRYVKKTKRSLRPPKQSRTADPMQVDGYGDYSIIDPNRKPLSSRTPSFRRAVQKERQASVPKRFARPYAMHGDLKINETRRPRGEVIDFINSPAPKSAPKAMKIPLSAPKTIQRQKKGPGFGLGPDENVQFNQPSTLTRVFRNVSDKIKTRWNAVDPDLNTWAKGIGGVAGLYLGGPTGAYLGSEGADLLHRAFKTVTGYGDYKVKSNSIIYPKGDDIPLFQRSGARTTRVRHREFITDVVSSSTAGAFQISTYPVNPGLSQTFPWLSQIAQQYEEYKIKGLLFEFKTTSSDALNSTNTALGTVVMASQYNVLNPQFTSKIQMENYEFGSSTKPSNSLLHPLECAPHETPAPELFTRTAATVVSGSDLRLYDHANFSIATVGLQGSSVNIGELWVTYDIELLKPKVGPNELSDAASSAHFQMDPAGYSVALDMFRYLDPQFRYKSPDSTLPVSFPAQNVFQMPDAFVGNLFVTAYITGNTAASLATTSATCSGNASQLKIFSRQSTASYSIGNGGVSSTVLIMSYAFSFNGGGKVTFGNGNVGPTGLQSIDWYFTPMYNNT